MAWRHPHYSSLYVNAKWYCDIRVSIQTVEWPGAIRGGSDTANVLQALADHTVRFIPHPHHITMRHGRR